MMKYIKPRTDDGQVLRGSANTIVAHMCKEHLAVELLGTKSVLFIAGSQIGCKPFIQPKVRPILTRYAVSEPLVTKLVDDKPLFTMLYQHFFPIVGREHTKAHRLLLILFASEDIRVRWIGIIYAGNAIEVSEDVRNIIKDAINLRV